MRVVPNQGRSGYILGPEYSLNAKKNTFKNIKFCALGVPIGLSCFITDDLRS